MHICLEIPPDLVKVNKTSLKLICLEIPPDLVKVNKTSLKLICLAIPPDLVKVKPLHFAVEGLWVRRHTSVVGCWE